MNYSQYRKARKLLNECCNFDNSHCLLLDTVCPQAISYTLLCNWFKEAILPLDKELSEVLLHKLKAKQCISIFTQFKQSQILLRLLSFTAKTQGGRQTAAALL